VNDVKLQLLHTVINKQCNFTDNKLNKMNKNINNGQDDMT